MKKQTTMTFDHHLQPETRKSQSIPTVLRGRPPCCSNENSKVLKKGPWTPEEDQMLVNYINQHGHGSWRSLPKRAGLNRCGKSCRLRWTNYLRPDIKRGKFSSDEEQTILNLHSFLGNKWSAIAGHLPGRTDNEIKNFWNTHLKKKLIQMGFDPMTHRPRTDIFSTLPHLIALASLKEMIDRRQWDDQVQLEAAQIAKLQQLQHFLLQSSSPTIGSGLMLEPTNLTINNNQRMTMVMNDSSSNTPPLPTQIPDLTEIQIQPMMTINEANDQGCLSSILPNLTYISAASCSSNSGSGISSVTDITTTTTFWPDEFFLDVGDQTFMSAGLP